MVFFNGVNMVKTIAVAGKGGAGKTTFAGLIIKYLLNSKGTGSILAIDADPDSNLADTLGVKQETSVVTIIDEVSHNVDAMPAGMTKERYLEYRLNDALIEAQGFDLLAMGKPEGPGCYCYANNMLRSLISKMSAGYDYAVIDNEAGLEHLSRRTDGKADILFIVSNYTPIGFKSAKRVFDLVKELKLEIKNTCLVLNQVEARDEFLDKQIKNLSIKIAGYLPQDEKILSKCIKGDSLLNLAEASKAFTAAKEILGEFL